MSMKMAQRFLSVSFAAMSEAFPQQQSKTKRGYQGKMLLPEILIRQPRTEKDVQQKQKFKIDLASI
jgi:hypothetical protein